LDTSLLPFGDVHIIAVWFECIIHSVTTVNNDLGFS
jgi:hypothetical protein